MYTTTLSGNQKLLDHEYIKTAWDMDGIFLDDVPSEHYKESLENALLMRDTYPLSPLAPILEEQDVIVTGRPMIDKDRTMLWMARHGIKTPLYLRDDQIDVPTKETTAEFEHFVYVLYPDSAVLVDSGYVIHFDKNSVAINDRDYERSKFDFVASQPTMRVYRRGKSL